MEEKKKRWRPSLTAYRELERRLEEQIEGTSLIVQECDGWRRKYRELADSNRVLARCAGDPARIVGELREKNETLEKSNAFLDGEISRLRERCRWLEEEKERLSHDLSALRERGFWARLLNRD